MKIIKKTRSRMQTKRILNNLNYIINELKLSEKEIFKDALGSKGYDLSHFKREKCEIPDETLFKIAETYQFDVNWFTINRFDQLYHEVKNWKNKKPI